VLLGYMLKGALDDVMLFDVALKPEQVARLAGLEGPKTAPAGEVGSFQARAAVNAVAFHPDGRTVIAGDHHGHVTFWDLTTKQKVKEFKWGGGHVTSLAVSSDGKTLVVTNGKVVKAFDFSKETGQVIAGADGSLPVIGARNGNVTISPDGRRVLLAGAGKAWLFDLVRGGKLDRFRDLPDNVQWGAFSPDGRSILLGAQRTAVLLEADTGKEVRRFEQERDWFIQPSFAADSRHFLAGSNAFSRPQLWEVETAKKVRDFSGHEHHVVLAVGFLPDGRRALSAGHDGTVRLWDVGGGRELACWKSHEPAEVHCLAISKDGNHAVTGDTDSTVRVWRLPAE
jgi:WD40 repeat protein